jgi:hypothetical protein
MQISILIRLNYVPEYFRTKTWLLPKQNQDLAAAKARVGLDFYTNISGELEVGLLLQLLHFIISFD